MLMVFEIESTTKPARACGIEQFPHVVRQREVLMAEGDRRVRRTRRILGEALVSLVLEKGYDQITVQDILDRADVGRSTFYAHYRDKDALFLANFDGMREKLLESVDATAASVDPARVASAVFGHAYQNRRVYQAMCGKHGGAMVYRHLHRLVTELLRKGSQPAGLPPDVVAEFYAGALLGLLVWWVDHDFRYGPAKLAAMYGELTEGVQGCSTAQKSTSTDERRL
jgi:AcrR family transcriptional regulator